MSWKRSIPNLLGLFRILATPLMAWFILLSRPETYLWAALLLLVMAVSDLLDGMIARRLNAVSPLGIFLDTISDKIFVVGVLLPLIERNLLSSWIALVIVVREFLVSGLRSYASAEGMVISAGKWGKQKLAITVVALVWLLLSASFDASGGQQLGGSDIYALFVGLWPVPMTLAVIWTVFSAVDYVWKAWPLLRKSWIPIPAQDSNTSVGQTSAAVHTPVHKTD
jgi:CDP-diacylglycerol--glycerol-3-phosphate 3-phosphatidyltransferase